MSTEPRSVAAAGGSGQADGEPDLQVALDALADPDCRRVIRAVSDEARTANECATDCDIPLSTVYRKLELLAEAGLVEEALRLRRDGKHASEYGLRFEAVRVGVESDGDLSVSVRRPDSGGATG